MIMRARDAKERKRVNNELKHSHICYVYRRFRILIYVYKYLRENLFRISLLLFI